MTYYKDRYKIERDIPLLGITDQDLRYGRDDDDFEDNVDEF